MIPWNQLTRLGQARRLRQLALGALGAWGIERPWPPRRPAATGW